MPRGKQARSSTARSTRAAQQELERLQHDLAAEKRRRVDAEREASRVGALLEALSLTRRERDELSSPVVAQLQQMLQHATEGRRLAEDRYDRLVRSIRVRFDALFSTVRRGDEPMVQPRGQREKTTAFSRDAEAVGLIMTGNAPEPLIEALGLVPYDEMMDTVHVAKSSGAKLPNPLGDHRSKQR